MKTIFNQATLLETAPAAPVMSTGYVRFVESYRDGSQALLDEHRRPLYFRQRADAAAHRLGPQAKLPRGATSCRDIWPDGASPANDRSCAWVVADLLNKWRIIE